MPLYILVPMILVGLPLVIGLVYWTTRGLPGTGLEEKKIIARFAEDYPNSRIDKIVLSQDGNHAFLFLQDEPGIGLVSKFGKNYITRILGSNDIGKIEGNGDEMVLILNDFTLRSLSARLDNENDRRQIIDRLTA